MEEFDGFAPWDGRRVPVTLLGGYLGSGKTTVINELLAATDRPVAVLVNDVGSVNVDAALIARRHGDTIELTDGCVCCSLAEGLVNAFEAIRDRETAPEHVVVELSGVADPARVVPWANSPGFRLDGVVVMVDADQFLEWRQIPAISGAVTAQLAAADLFLISKADLVDEQRLHDVTAALTELHPDVPAFRSDGPTSAANFLNLATRSGSRFTDLPAPTLFDVHTTSTTPLPDPVPLAQVEAILDELDHSALRAKAVIRDPGGQTHLVQQVGRRRIISPLPNAEQQPTTDLVVISARK